MAANNWSAGGSAADLSIEGKEEKAPPNSTGYTKAVSKAFLLSSHPSKSRHYVAEKGRSSCSPWEHHLASYVAWPTTWPLKSIEDLTITTIEKKKCLKVDRAHHLNCRFVEHCCRTELVGLPTCCC